MMRMLPAPDYEMMMVLVLAMLALLALFGRGC